MKENSFLIKTQNFEGPFSFLLELIKQKKFSINDISLGEITNKYIAFIKNNEFKLMEVSSFIVIASTLLLIKSRTLIPQLPISEEEEQDIDLLKFRLKYLREIQSISEVLKLNIYKNVLIKKKFKKNIIIKFQPNQNINIKKLLLSLDDLVNNSTNKIDLPKEKIKKQLSLKEVIDRINEKINRFLKLNFSELIVGKNKKDISVNFLAILELFKNQKIELIQEKNFDEILIHQKRK